jgi:uncharacterized SAM-binding protein YcdF (DUF218 family)
MKVILVLGNSNKDVMKKRLDRAISEYKLFNDDNSNVYLMVSGCGKKHEYKFMYNYLISNVDTKNILVEDKSNSTIENLIFSTNILKNKFPIQSIELIVCTSTFHIKRTIIISKLLNIHSIKWNFIHTEEDVLDEQKIKEMNLTMNLIDYYSNNILSEKIIYDLT